MKTIIKNRTTILATALVALVALPAVADEIPKRPENITFRPLVFNAPKATEYRHVLSNGVVVFLAPSRELPLIDLTMTFRGGDFLEPSDK
ncbi:MAG: insulinase family protein, partial [bacterium]